MNKLSIIAVLVSIGLLVVGGYFLGNPVDRLQEMEDKAEMQNENKITGNLDPDVAQLTFDTYTNHDYNFSMLLPIDWELVEEDKALRLYSEENLAATNNAYGDQSDLLVEFDVKFMADPSEIYKDEKQFEERVYNGSKIISFERDIQGSDLQAVYIILANEKGNLSFVYLKGHPYSNFMKYMVESVSFFDEE